MPRYEVVLEIKWTGVSRIPVYVEAVDERTAMQDARYENVRDAIPTDAEIEEIRVESVQEDR